MQDDSYIVLVKPVDRRYRTRDTVLTLFMWGIYIYLWIPLITLTAWLLGFERFYAVMVSYGGFAVALDLLDLYALMIIGIVICILSWSGFNYYRFHGRERRYASPVTDLGAFSEHFGLPEAAVEYARGSRRMQIELDEMGNILKIEHTGHAGDDGRIYCRQIAASTATKQSQTDS